MKRIGEKGIAGTHIIHMEGYSPGIEIEFVSLGFHLNKIESNRLEFNIIELEPEGLDLHAYVDEISTSAAATI